MMNRWVANQLGLVNFWYYDEEIFELEEGKILLRGSNGSGKSVTMQSFIPLLLDGNKAPERLDPFGTKSRKIENYLLDENTDEKTAYLYIEFKRKDTENYLTIGMGMKAVRNKPLQSWYFLITDNRRIGKDLYLYRDMGQKVPLTKKQLQNEIGEGGIYLESQREYMSKVNTYLFGFESVDTYEELLSLLINLRSPKLSKDFKPTEIYKILQDSLKVLSEDDLRPMSESMENMDSLQSALDTYKSSKKACKNIETHYKAYNQYCMVAKASDVVHKKEELDKVIKEKKQEEASIKAYGEEMAQLTSEQVQDELELKKAEEKYTSLSGRQELQIKKQLHELIERQKQLQITREGKVKQLEDKKEMDTALDYERKDILSQWEGHEKAIKAYLENLEDLAQYFAFEEGGYVEQEMSEDYSAYKFEAVRIALQKYVKKLEVGEEALAQYEKIKEEEAQALQQKDTLEKTADEHKREKEKAQELVQTAREDYKVSVVSWQKNAQHMPLAPSLETDVFRMVDQIEMPRELLNMSEKVSEVKQAQEAKYKVNVEMTKQAITQEWARIEAIQQEIQRLKTAKEITFEREEAVRANREHLKAQGIPFIPLYKAVDFKKETPEHIAAIIESALADMGLLDALVVNNKDAKTCLSLEGSKQDKYIMGQSNMMAYHLGQYLQVDPSHLDGVSYEAVDQALMSIFLDEAIGAYISEDGHYGLGVVKGKTRKDYEPKYIGVSARKKHREQVIADHEQEIEKIKKGIKAYEDAQAHHEAMLCALESEYLAFPKLIDVQAMLELRDKVEKAYTYAYEMYLKQEEVYGTLRLKLQQEKVNVYDKTGGIQLQKTLEAFKEALQYASQYKDELAELRMCQTQLQSTKSQKEMLEERLESIREDMDILYSEIHRGREEERDVLAKQEALQEMLAATDIAAIEKEIEWCLEVKRSMPQKLRQIHTRLGELKGLLSNCQNRQETLLQKTEQCEERFAKAKCLFEEEKALGYVQDELGEDVVTSCRSLCSQYPLAEDKTKEDYTSALIEALNKNNSELKEYHLKPIKIQDRIDLRGRIESKEIGFYQLENTIQQYIEETQMLISEEERHIFEEVLLNTISSKITSKIYLSKQWVDKINQLMESMNTSSSLKLSLKWLPQKAEVEGEMHISELLNILERGDRCSEEDLKKIAKHFAAKVKDGIRSCEEVGEIRNYHTIIKEVLDYRQWYTFKLSYEKKNEAKKELTNNAFFQFSGGEKAMSMYIPLFSAVYARYDSASKECPRLIAMDEAFAGVDENNIRDMFRLLKELDLDFVINSQVLWGDYDTVEKLSICEIIREENDTTVVVLRYHWNGKEKVLL